jgi:hypothetical protein
VSEPISTRKKKASRCVESVFETYASPTRNVSGLMRTS